MEGRGDLSGEVEAAVDGADVVAAVAHDDEEVRLRRLVPRHRRAEQVVLQRAHAPAATPPAATTPKGWVSFRMRWGCVCGGRARAGHEVGLV